MHHQAQIMLDQLIPLGNIPRGESQKVFLLLFGA